MRDHQLHSGRRSTASGLAVFSTACAIVATTLALPAVAAAELTAQCALPFVIGKTGYDCSTWHRIVFSTSGAGPGAKVTAELLGMALDGTVIKAMPVKLNDDVYMASRLDPQYFLMTSTPKAVGSTHQVLAPIPMLRITVEDNGQKAQAFCSNIPYMQMIEPRGTVVTEDAGNLTNVVAMIPRVYDGSVSLKVDGVDVFGALGVLPENCDPITPCGGIVNIGGQPVTVSNLIVDSGRIGVLSSNTLKATVGGLSCGGHYYTLNGVMQAGAMRVPTSSWCHVDDLAEKGSSSVFGITLTTPLEQSSGNAVPTPVKGEVCGGRDIVSVALNGKPLPTPLSKVFTPGNGTTTGDKVVVKIDTAVSETDLLQDITSGNAPIGSFDAGSNRLVASAQDDLGTRTFKRRVFATGNVAPIGVDASAVIKQAALQSMVERQLKAAVEPTLFHTLNATSTEIENAFVVGVSAKATQDLFNKLCTTPLPATKPDGTPNDPALVGLTPGQIFQKKTRDAILAIGPKTITPGVPCASDPDVALTISGVTVGDTVTCNVQFFDDKFHVTLGLPSVRVDVHAYGTGGDWGDDVCLEGIKIEGDAYAEVTGIKLDFDVTEGQLMGNPPPDPVFDVGSTFKDQGNVSVDFCGFSVFCNVLVTIFTFGAVDINPEISFDKVQDFSFQIGAGEPDPVRLNKIKVDEEVVANFNQKLSGAVSSVQITPSGIVAGLKGQFATTMVDTEVETTPGVTLTPASVPTLPVANAEDIFIGISDDAINMMFASLTAAGNLKNQCKDTGVDIGNLLPANCETIVLKKEDGTTNLLATALARGACHGVKGTNCETIAMSATVNDINTATEQGVCHAFQGSNCNAIPLPAGPIAAATEKAVCTNTPNPNLHANQSLLFCTRQDVPPRMLLEDATSTTAVESSLRLNDLSVALVVDKTGDAAIDGALADVTPCFGTGVNTAVDCNLFAVCLDVNLNFDMQFQTCIDPVTSEQKPGFYSSFKTIQILNRQAGAVCGGASTATIDSALVDGAATDETVTIDLGQNASTFSPPVCGAGLTLGGFVSCQQAKLITINTDVSPALKDYIAITCKSQ